MIGGHEGYEASKIFVQLAAFVRVAPFFLGRTTTLLEQQRSLSRRCQQYLVR